MKFYNLKQITAFFYIATLIHYLIIIIYFSNRAPELIIYHSYSLVFTSLGLISLRVFLKKVKPIFIGIMFVGLTLVLSYGILLNHEYYVENFKNFQPYIGIKLLAFSIALLAPTPQWIGWTSLAITLVLPLSQYYSWSAIYRDQLGIQEPIMTICFFVAASAIYINRLFTVKLLKKEIISLEKIAIYERLTNIIEGLKHLNNTPLQTIEMSLQLLRAEFPQAKSLIDSIERSYTEILKINNLLGKSATPATLKSASTIKEFERDIREMGKYLQT